jgi:putative hydrolase of the HAD superfamily
VIQALTIDAAGTMISPHPSVGAVYAAVARSHGLAVAAPEVDAAFPAAFTATVATWPVPYGKDEADALAFWSQVIRRTLPAPVPDAVCAAIYAAFQAPAAWRVLPGVRATLALAAARGLPVAVVSNFDCRLEPLLRALALGPFTAVVTSAQIGRAKPDPAVLIHASTRLGVDPTKILHIGDHVREDGGMCAAVGARFLAVTPHQGIDSGQVNRLLGGRIG